MARNISCSMLFERSNGSFGHDVIMFFLYVPFVSKQYRK